MDDKLYNELTDAQLDLNNQKHSHVKMVSSILIGLLGLLVALKPDKIVGCNEKLIYMAILSTIALGAFCSLIFLYSLVAYSKRKRDALNVHMLAEYKMKKKVPSISKVLKWNKLYSFCGVMTYVCLSISILLLVCFAWLSL